MATKKAKRTRRKVDSRVLGLGDADLKERLQGAAKAAGVASVEELADLIADSGVVARPPVDPLTERFTLEELGVRIWTAATQQPRDVRKEWFGKLVPVQQTAVITTLRHRGYSAHTISNDLGIEELAVEKIYSDYATKLGEQVLGVRLDTLAGQITANAQRAQEMAVKKGDPSAFWRIEKERVGILQDLGVVQRAIHRVEVVNKAEESKAAALQRLVSLAEKKARRGEEIRQVEASVVQSLPADVEEGLEELRDG